MNGIWYWFILIAVNIPVYLGLGRLIFGNWDNFSTCLRFFLMPDIVSWFRGEWIEDQLATIQFIFWLLGCALVVYLEHLGLQWLMSR